jgi:hypothetical protein
MLFMLFDRLVVPMFNGLHPRVWYTTCQCVQVANFPSHFLRLISLDSRGRLCTDVEVIYCMLSRPTES